ncbi:hypothetical protein RINTHH_19030 [Richelia intracellularis HH01]|uniref:Uncharacterized protein n=1 Tax=Richelia intracellularis HH01 TaxID=1165094 RepID=M1X1B7_9NOST|nr:hypothetical protein RINTHH_19030 [Richelia intracellularis HH01]
MAGAVTTIGCACTTGLGATNDATFVGTLGVAVATIFWFTARRLKPHWPQKAASVCTVAPQLGQLVVDGSDV